ncbi:RHS repeat domain-containing protein [Chryseobacterium sp. SIMBA_038]|uniref:RHS repeat domain-containing protein n=1 Tax=Chryseobacterium sp. SIMBA_038 TaxID=3085780 RepID=UPI003978CA42
MVQKHKVDNNTEEILAQNEYNELSQLKNKKVGGINTATPLQSIDYSYDIRGQLTKINDPANLNGKLFGYEIKYNNPVNPNIASPRYNGNISEVDWKNSSEDVLKRYDYSYNSLNRLQDAVYSEPNSTTPFNNNFNESLTYDLNGNISTLKRNAFPVSGNTSTLVDDLTYQYTGNRLDKVIENSFNDTGYEGGNNVISYDLNGNMTNMKDKGIQTINYNYLNLANQLSIKYTNPLGKVSNTSINYLYRADGTKLRKTYDNIGDMGANISRMTDYLDGFQYSYEDNGTGGICMTCRTEVAYETQAYKKGLIGGPVLPAMPEWKLSFLPTAEGFYSFTENRYIYQYKDHLGNARVSFAKNSAGVLQTTDTNNFYPFGLSHIGGSAASNFGNYYSYKNSGKELQETGFYDYGWRQYMPDIGRWNGIDQLAEKYLSTSTYAYVANNPISLSDVDGRWFDEDGHIINTSGQTMGLVGKKLLNSFLGRTADEGGGGDSGGITIGDILDAQAANSVDFSQFDFTKYGKLDTDEEPVNFFGKTGADAPFYQKFQEMFEMFKGTAGDGIFRAFGHGGYGNIYDGETAIHTADKFDTLMNKRNSNWKNVDKIKDAILILYVCRTATDYPDLKNYKTFGEKVSRAHPNLTVIAFDEYVTYDNSVKGMRNVNLKENTGDGLGSIIFYRNGQVLKRQEYKEFLKKYPNFQ